MKSMFFALCFLCSTAAFGQYGGGSISSRVQPLQIDSNPLHASFQPLAPSQDLSETNASTYTYARGERPLWEVAVPTHEIPLGDSARALRKEHDVVKKSVRVWSN